MSDSRGGGQARGGGDGVTDREFTLRDGRIMKSRDLMRWTDDGVTFPDDLTIEEAYQVADGFMIHPFSDDVGTMKRAIRKAAKKLSRNNVSWGSREA